MKIVILDAKTLGDCDLSPIKKFGNFMIYPTTSPEQTLEHCLDADIVLTNKVTLNAQILGQLHTLKLICVTATGTNIIDLKKTEDLGIIVKNVAGYSTQSVAQHTLTFALNFLSNFNYYDEYCKSGQWCKSEIFAHINGGLNELNDKKWGIIGLGAIGERVATLAKAFGAEISYTSTSGRNHNAPYSQKPLELLLKESDIISIHAPLNSTTQNLIAQKELALIKEGSILINVGRGGIVNEIDLAQALQNKNFFFGTDVLENEPMKKNHPFLNPQIQNKILLTPHIAWAYSDARKILIKKVIENIKEFLGETSI